MNLKNISMADANARLAKHYLGPVKYSPMFCLSDEGDQALAVYSPPVASSFKIALAGRADRPGEIGALELARLYKVDGSPLITSQFLSATLRWLRANTGAPCVFSYADPAQDHKGTIYKATGFYFLGESRTTDAWITPNGEIVSAPQCYRRFKTKNRDKILAINPTWQLRPSVPKLLFIFPLRKSLQSTLRAIGGRYAVRLGKPAGDHPAHRGSTPRDRSITTTPEENAS